MTSFSFSPPLVKPLQRGEYLPLCDPVKFLFVMTNKKARTTEVVIRTNILLSNKGDFLIPQLTTEDSISRPFARPIRFGLRIILMLKQLFLRSSSGLRTS